MARLGPPARPHRQHPAVGCERGTDEDDQPVAGERYRMELPNGRVVQARTTADGLARVDDIADPGACKINFPDRDVETWEPV